MLIYETSVLGMTVRVFVDRVEYKAGFMSAVDIIPVSQIASIRIGSWLMNRMVIETTGGREYLITTDRKREVAHAIYQAQAALRASATGGYVTPMPNAGVSYMPQGSQRRASRSSLVIGAVVALVGLIALGAAVGPSSRTASHEVRAAAAKTFDTGNHANDELLARSPDDQATVLAAAIVDGCQGTRAFYAGMNSQDHSAFWDVGCANGSNYRIKVDADESGTVIVLNCLALKAIADLDCFVSVNSPSTRPPRSEQQIKADIAALPPRLKQQVVQQLEKNLQDYSAKAPTPPTRPARAAAHMAVSKPDAANPAPLGPDDLMPPSDPSTTTKQIGTIGASPMDCSTSVVEPTDKRCQKQFCSKHADDPACGME